MNIEKPNSIANWAFLILYLSNYVGRLRFSLSRLQLARFSGHKPAHPCGTNTPQRWSVLCLPNLNGSLRFSYVQTPAPSPSSRFSLSSNGKDRHYRQGFQRLSGLNGRLRFSYKFRLQFHLAEAVDFAVDVMIAFD